MKSCLFKDEDFWENKEYDDETFTIQFSIKRKVVRARLDSLAPWEYVICDDIRKADDIAFRILDRQKIERENYPDDINYQGA